MINRTLNDEHNKIDTEERKLKWDEENRLLASDDGGFVTNYWYDADGERTVKTSGESEQVYVNSEFAGGRTSTAKFSLYVSPYLVANQGGRYTKHIYIGSQRIVSKLGDFASYGADPRRIEYAGSEADAVNVDYDVKYSQQLQAIKENYATFGVPYNGTDNDDYVNGEGFCCDDGTMEAAMAQANAPEDNFQEGDAYENLQFYYHADHLGSSSYITNLDGEVVQHIEYVPFGEVFIEERNNIWNTPYLFNAKEFDEETGLYYYGARYYDPRLSLWMSTDPLEEKSVSISTYTYCMTNPINKVDVDGRDIVHINNKGQIISIENNGSDNITIVQPNGVQHLLSDYYIDSFLGLGLNNGTNRQIVANVVGYYGSKLGINRIGATDIRIDGAIAFYKNSNDMIWVGPNESGRPSTFLNNKYNLMNILLHEELHRKYNKNKNKNKENHLTHARIVLEASIHYSFKKGTMKYREGQVGYFSQLIMNAYFRGKEKEAIDLIRQYNNAKLGCKLEFNTNQKTMYINGTSKIVF